MRFGLDNVNVVRKWALRYKGSKRSGNYGHSGRPGKIGGSASAVVLSPEKIGKRFKSRGIIVDGGRVGRVQYKKIGTRLHINEIVIDSEVRGRGIGSSAILQLLEDTNSTKLSHSTPTEAGAKLFDSLSKRGVIIQKKQYKKKSLSVRYRYKGSPKSGHRGHAGRPGKQGGSAPKSYVLSDISRNSGDNVDAYRSEFADWASSIKDSELGKSVERYTNISYGPINEHLRGTGLFFSTVTPKGVIELDAALAKAPRVKADTLVYRGISKNYLWRLKPGDTIKDKGFVSTSVDGSKAAKFAKGGDSANIVIIIPKGSKAGAYVEELSVHSGELEWIMPRGSLYEVVSKPGRSSAHYTLLYKGADPDALEATKEKSSIAGNRLDKFTWNPDDLVLIKKKSLSVRYRIK